MNDQPRLLSGGNPQIPKGDGDAPVEDYLAAMPDWKQTVGRQLDELITTALPDVHKSVRWNTPFYSTTDDQRDWFVSFHCLTKYIKVAFARGTDLDPMPPESSKVDGPRYLHIFEDSPLDEVQFTAWINQAIDLSSGPYS